MTAPEPAASRSWLLPGLALAGGGVALAAAFFWPPPEAAPPTPPPPRPTERPAPLPPTEAPPTPDELAEEARRREAEAARRAARAEMERQREVREEQAKAERDRRESTRARLPEPLGAGPEPPKAVTQRVEAARTLLERGGPEDLQRARTYLEEAIENAPTWPEAWGWLAHVRAYLARRAELQELPTQELWEGARLAAEEAIRLAHEGSVEAPSLGDRTRGHDLGVAARALVQAGKGEVAAARATLRELRHAPDLAPVYLVEAELQPGGPTVGRGRGLLHSAAEAGLPVEAALSRARARLRRARRAGDPLEKRREARAAFEAAVDGSVHQDEAVAFWLVAEEAARLLPEAPLERLTALSHARSRAPESGFVLARLAGVYLDLAASGRAREAGIEDPLRRAEEALARARELAPGHPAVLHLEGRMALLHRDLEAADRALRAAAEAVPDNPAYQREAQRVATRLGDRSYAISRAEARVAEAPRDPSLRSNLAGLYYQEGRSLERSGETTAAKGYYQKAMQAASSRGMLAYKRSLERLRVLARKPVEIQITVDGDRETRIEKHPDKTIKEIRNRKTGALLNRWVWEK